MKLTPVNECLVALSDEEVHDDASTVDLLEYALREFCSDSEYHLANRVLKIRQLVWDHISSDSNDISKELLRVLDISMPDARRFAVGKHDDSTQEIK